MSFSYLLKIKLGEDNTGLTLKAALQDKDGTAVLFSDGDATKTAGFIEQGVGDYSLWTDQWPNESFPFTVLILNDADDSLLTTADMNALDFIIGSGGGGSSASQQSTQWNALPVESWREIIAYHPFHFWGLSDSQYVPVTSACNTLVREYAWQDAQQLGRSEIRRAIAVAEARIAEHLNYHVGRRFVQETLQYPWPGVSGHQHANSADGRNRWLSIRASEGYIRNVGTERYTAVSLDAVVAYSDEDADGLQETATVTVATSVTNPDELGVYFKTADRLDNENVSERWRIAPAKVSISGGVATITFRKWLAVKPIRYEGFLAGNLSATSSVNFVTAVDVYRRWCDPDGITVDDAQAVLIWETAPYPSWAICCADSNSPSYSTNERDPAAVAYGIARAGIRDARHGEIAVGAAVYNSSTGEWIGADWGICRQPDRVILRYEAGARLDAVESTGFQSRPEGRWDETIARLAAAEMTRRICACDVANQELYRWQFDLARSAGANDEQYRIADSDLNNPLGTKAGQVYAWRRIVDRMLTQTVTF